MKEIANLHRVGELYSKGRGSHQGRPAAFEEAKSSARARGAEIKAFYLVMGQYDANDEAAAVGALAAGARGYIRTETLRAFTEAEYRKIVAALP